MIIKKNNTGELSDFKNKDTFFENKGNRDHLDEIGLGGSEISAGNQSNFKALSTFPLCHPQYASLSPNYQTPQ